MGFVLFYFLLIDVQYQGQLLGSTYHCECNASKCTILHEVKLVNSRPKDLTKCKQVLFCVSLILLQLALAVIITHERRVGWAEGAAVKMEIVKLFAVVHCRLPNMILWPSKFSSLYYNNNTKPSYGIQFVGIVLVWSSCEFAIYLMNLWIRKVQCNVSPSYTAMDIFLET